MSKKLIAWLLTTALALGCARTPEQASLRAARQLMQEGKLQDALNVVEQSLQQNPEAPELLRLRIFILLKADRPDLASLALQRIPANDPVLTLAIRTRDPSIRMNAAKLIADRPRSVDRSVLVAGLDDSLPDVRRSCAQALGKLRDPAAVRPLFRILHDDNWFVRAEAISALGKIGDPRAAGWLLQLLRDGDGFVRYKTALALRDVVTADQREMLLQEMNKARDIERQLNIAIALSKFQEPAALGPLTNAAEQDDADLRRHAAAALGAYATAAATNALTKLLIDPDPDVREQAAQSLQRIRGKFTDAKAGS